MLNKTDSGKALTDLFQGRPVVELSSLFSALKTKSRMSVFRRLKDLEYLSSYSHQGRFYTLRRIPTFDLDGLWCYRGICFSGHGSLKSTLIHIVEAADTGRTHHELQVRLRIRVHNTLLDLVGRGRLGRLRWQDQYLYVGADLQRAATQAAARRKYSETITGMSGETTASTILDVLLELVRSAGVAVDAGQVAERLQVRGLPIGAEQVEDIFRHHGVKKRYFDPDHA